MKLSRRPFAALATIATFAGLGLTGLAAAPASASTSAVAAAAVHSSASPAAAPSTTHGRRAVTSVTETVRVSPHQKRVCHFAVSGKAGSSSFRMEIKRDNCHYPMRAAVHCYYAGNPIWEGYLWHYGHKRIYAGWHSYAKCGFDVGGIGYVSTYHWQNRVLIWKDGHHVLGKWRNHFLAKCGSKGC